MSGGLCLYGDRIFKVIPNNANTGIRVVGLGIFRHHPLSDCWCINVIHTPPLSNMPKHTRFSSTDCQDVSILGCRYVTPCINFWDVQLTGFINFYSTDARDQVGEDVTWDGDLTAPNQSHQWCIYVLFRMIVSVLFQ